MSCEDANLLDKLGYALFAFWERGMASYGKLS